MRLRWILFLASAALLVGAFLINPVVAHAQSVFRMDEAPVGEIDPAKATDFSDSILMFNLYDTLVTMPRGGGDLQPHLAESWNTEGTAVTFTLREGVSFHSGNVLDADDVVFSFERMVDLGQGFSHLFAGWVEGAEAIDANTVRFHLSTSYVPFLGSLVRLPIVDKDTVMANLQEGDFGERGDYGQAYLSGMDAGTGAYRIVSHNPQEVTVMEKFDGYFLGVQASAPDTARLRYGLEAATVRTLLDRGEHELSSPYLPPEVFAALAKEDGISLVSHGLPGQFYFKLNTTRPPLDDKHCRRALAYAVDYDAILHVVAIGDTPGGYPARGPLVRGMLGWDETIPASKQDMEKAKAELAQCKYDPSEHELEIMWITEAPIEERFALIMQANFNELGFQSQILALPWALFTERASKPETTPHVNQVVVVAVTPDPDSLLYNMYHSAATGSWTSVEWLQNEDVDRLLEQGRTTQDSQERHRIYRELTDLLFDLQPTIFGHERVHIMAKRDVAQMEPLEDPAQLYPLHGMNFMFRDVVMK